MDNQPRTTPVKQSSKNHKIDKSLAEKCFKDTSKLIYKSRNDLSEKFLDALDDQLDEGKELLDARDLKG